MFSRYLNPYALSNARLLQKGVFIKVFQPGGLAQAERRHLYPFAGGSIIDHSNRKIQRRKPSKPRLDFPLYVHAA